MVNLLITIVFENGFQEIYLPNVNNKTVPITIRPHVSGLKYDVILPLDVWDGIWNLNESMQFVITQNERVVGKTKLVPGLLLNCQLAGGDTVFSFTVGEANEGNSQFDKFLLDLEACPWIKIGSGEGSIIRYNNKFCSPNHAEISIDKGEHIVRDLNSVNGTFVNGHLLSGDHILRYGDVIYIIGLKIVYLGNVLAANNPNNNRWVDDLRLKEIKIEAFASNDSEGEEIYTEDTYFLRTPRKLEKLDSETFTIEKAPPRNEQKRQPIIFTIGPAFTMMIPIIAGAVMMGGQGSIAGGLAMSVGAGIIGAMWAILNIRYEEKNEKDTEAGRVSKYSEYISKVAERFQEKSDSNRQILERMLPSSDEVRSFVKGPNPRLWEKSGSHDDFLSLRLGVGNIPSPNNIEVPKEQIMPEHDPLNDKVESIKESMAFLREVPVDLSFYNNRVVGIVSPKRDSLLNLGRLVTLQLTGLHPYTDLRMAFVYHMHEEEQWNYVRFLPHVWSPDETIRLIANDKNTVGDIMYFLGNVIRDRLEQGKDQRDDKDIKTLPHYVLVIGDWSLVENEPIAKYLMDPDDSLGITVVFLVDSADKLPSGCRAIVYDEEKDSGFYSTTGSFPQRDHLIFDKVSLEDVDIFARKLSGIKVREMNVSSAIPDLLTFLDMYRTSRVEDLDMLHKWLENRTYESMKSMVGFKSGNQPLYLDIHEKYHGPHGLVAGTTGSGKSETLQSYILSLVVNYHPHEVAFILIDYKGGGMAQSFLGLPHLSGVITNLGGNATNRALLSINAEIKSRQRIFNEFKVKHIDAYIELYRSGEATEPMPHLLIIADEFAELKKEQPEFVKALVSAARVGRSLGINLILATQKPSGVVDDEIWSNTRFRLCLRVADKQDSNEMLKRPDAAFISGTGRGFYQVGNDEIFEEFQSGWSGAEYEPDVPFADDKNVKSELINLIGKSGVPKQKKKKKSDNIAKVTQLDALVGYAATIAVENNISPIKQIWLPPLPKVLYLEDLKLEEKPQGFSMILPVGLADDPENQSQYPVAVNFLTNGNLLICGPGGSGRTSLMQTLIYGATARYSPEEVNVYIADFSSRTMAVFAGLPHVGAVMFEGDDEKIGEIFDLLQSTLIRRKSEFSREGIGSFREYVSQKDDCPAILFFIDNYVAFIESYEEYEDTLGQLSREAASYGIYLVLSMNNSGELRSRIRQNFTSGIGLQMPDRFEYEAVIGARSEITPEDRIPGRGLIKAPLPVEFQVALCLREKPGLSLAQTLRRNFESMKFEKGIKKLGTASPDLTLDSLMLRSDIKGLSVDIIPIGISASDDELAKINLDDEFCYTLGGLAGTGKTNLLAHIAKQAKEKGAKLYLFDKEPGTLEAMGIFDACLYSDSQLFDLMEGVIVPEFTRRNGAVNEARDKGRNILDAMGKYDRIIFIINDMSAFMRAVYSPNMDMSEFIEVAFEKGYGHKIQFFAAVTPDDYVDMAKYAAMRIWAGWNRGIHLGGMFDQQSILHFDMTAADSVRQLPPGVGYMAGGDSKAIKIVTPLLTEKGEKHE